MVDNATNLNSKSFSQDDAVENLRFGLVKTFKGSSCVSLWMSGCRQPWRCRYQTLAWMYQKTRSIPEPPETAWCPAIQGAGLLHDCRKILQVFLSSKATNRLQGMSYWGQKRVSEELWILGLIAFSIYYIMHGELLSLLFHESTLTVLYKFYKRTTYI